MEAILFLMDKENVIAKPAGAVGVATVMANPEKFRNKNAAMVISLGNLDMPLTKPLIE